MADTGRSVIAGVGESGDAGIDVRALGERERAVLDSIDEVVVDAGLVLPADAIDPYVDHPFLSELLAGGFSPPSAAGVDRNDIRELARRGHIVAHEGLVFHAQTIDAAAHIAAQRAVSPSIGNKLSATNLALATLLIKAGDKAKVESAISTAIQIIVRHHGDRASQLFLTCTRDIMINDAFGDKPAKAKQALHCSRTGVPTPATLL